MRTLQLAVFGLLAMGAAAHATETPKPSTINAAGIAVTDMKAFGEAMDRSMARMHEGMAAAKPTGDPDRDFAAMMIPHHQGAVEMAEIQLRFGRDERLRRLAQGIIVEQRQEIAVMQRILDEKPAARGQAAGISAPAHGHHDHKDMKP
ncbi:protein of unknown function [Bosea sp. CRIB-10]|jgi:uncharacterized protein (DUF305 family)|nr:DUF305 domain-containing protein [Bosea sp. CRIB-10]SFD31106.1 protein of unknown function [Bosea sp. CRIB-10]